MSQPFLENLKTPSLPKFKNVSGTLILSDFLGIINVRMSGPFFKFFWPTPHYGHLLISLHKTETFWDKCPNFRNREDPSTLSSEKCPLDIRVFSWLSLKAPLGAVNVTKIASFSLKEPFFVAWMPKTDDYSTRYHDSACDGQQKPNNSRDFLPFAILLRFGSRNMRFFNLCHRAREFFWSFFFLIHRLFVYQSVCSFVLMLSLFAFYLLALESCSCLVPLSSFTLLMS